jgi:DNA repair ATPase RecN
MGKPDKVQVSALVAAAEALEDDLVSLEEISRSVLKLHLNSEKALARAANELQQVLALPERMQLRLQAMAAAMAQMQARQQAALDPLTVLATQIQARAQLLQKHMEAYAELGKATAGINDLISVSEGNPETLNEAGKRLQDLSTRARNLAEAARVDDFTDVFREADVLKQRLAAMGKRLAKAN